MLQKTLLSLAVAGTLSASQFLGEVKNFSANTDAQTLNKEAAAIKRLSSRSLSNEQQTIIKTSIETMFQVNERTYTDFLPAVEASIQRWSKEDNNNLLEAIDLMSAFLDLRLKQYKNMKNMLKNTNIDKSLLDDISNMDKMSRNAKKILTSYKDKALIIDSIQSSLYSVKLENDMNVSDFWMPILEEKSDVMVKVSGLKDSDFDAIDKVESFLNENIESQYIHSIMVA